MTSACMAKFQYRKKPGSIHVKSVSGLLLGARGSRSARMGPVKGPYGP